MKKITITLLLISLFILTTCEKNDFTEPERGFTYFEADTFHSEKITNRYFSYYDYTLVIFWGTFSDTYINQIFSINELYTVLLDKNISILGICLDGSTNNDLAKEIISNNKSLYQNLVYNSDFENELLDYSVVPLAFIVDSKGNKIGDPITGIKNVDEYLARIEKLSN